MTSRIQFDLATNMEPALRRRSRAAPGGGLIAWLREAAARWRGRRILEMPGERMLRDIGISRSQAIAEASKPCWRK